MENVVRIQYNSWGNANIKNRQWVAKYPNGDVDYGRVNYLIKECEKEGYCYKVLRHHRNGEVSILKTNCLSKTMLEKYKNKIIQGDCIEVMKDMPDKSIDLVLTDPPYGITKADWDKVPSKEYFDEIFRISKRQIIFGGHWFDLLKKDGWIIWNKMPFLKTTNQAEFIWTSFLKKNIIIDFRYAGNVIGNTKRPDYKVKKVLFTSQKPLKFIELLIETYTEENDLILDPFLGSGTTAVACKQLNRNFIGIEISEKYCEIARQRLRQEVLL